MLISADWATVRRWRTYKADTAVRSMTFYSTFLVFLHIDPTYIAPMPVYGVRLRSGDMIISALARCPRVPRRFRAILRVSLHGRC